RAVPGWPRDDRRLPAPGGRSAGGGPAQQPPPQDGVRLPGGRSHSGGHPERVQPGRGGHRGAPEARPAGRLRPAAGPGRRAVDQQRVVVRRSSRRRKTVSAYREAGRTVVAIPSGFSRAEEDTWVRRMLARLAASDRRRRPDGEELTRRAQTLARQYLDERA